MSVRPSKHPRCVAKMRIGANGAGPPGFRGAGSQEVRSWLQKRVAELGSISRACTSTRYRAGSWCQRRTSSTGRSFLHRHGKRAIPERSRRRITHRNGQGKVLHWEGGREKTLRAEERRRSASEVRYASAQEVSEAAGRLSPMSDAVNMCRLTFNWLY